MPSHREMDSAPVRARWQAWHDLESAGTPFVPSQTPARPLLHHAHFPCRGASPGRLTTCSRVVILGMVSYTRAFMWISEAILRGAADGNRHLRLTAYRAWIRTAPENGSGSGSGSCSCSGIGRKDGRASVLMGRLASEPIGSIPDTSARELSMADLASSKCPGEESELDIGFRGGRGHGLGLG
jgi:hypothetical protein